MGLCLYIHLTAKLQFKTFPFRLMSDAQDGAYWASWGLTHWTTMAISGLLCALISNYPFPASDWTVLLVLLWLIAASLVACAYALSACFSTSRVAGTAAVLVYALAMAPG